MIKDKIYSAPEKDPNTENFKHEIYELNEYNRFGICVEPGDVVLDCGGNVGIFTDYALDLGAKMVYSYEADEETFEHYKKNINSDKVISTLEFVGHDHYNIGKIMDQHNLNKIDFAKIDIEGSEWDLFKFMSSEELKSVRKWAIEFHTFSGHPDVSLEDKKNNLWNFLEILEKFSINGFEIYYEHIHKEWDVVHLFAISKDTKPLPLENFDWGWMNEDSNIYNYESDGTTLPITHYHKRAITREIFQYKLYEKFFEVEQNDVVLDVGASIGPFTYSILHKKPKHVYCLEPSKKEFPTLINNTVGYPVTPINKGISNLDGLSHNDQIFDKENRMDGIKFSSLVKIYNLNQIDFLKTDCEGGEYDIFNDENFDWITKNIKKIVGEWHLSNPELKEKFRGFRDTYLKYYNNFEVMSVDNHFIKWDLWNEHFINYYDEVIINIDNR